MRHSSSCSVFFQLLCRNLWVLTILSENGADGNRDAQVKSKDLTHQPKVHQLMIGHAPCQLGFEVDDLSEDQHGNFGRYKPADNSLGATHSLFANEA